MYRHLYEDLVFLCCDVVSILYGLAPGFVKFSFDNVA